MKSEVSVLCPRLRGVQLPDQTRADIAAVVKGWPKWRQKIRSSSDIRLREGLFSQVGMTLKQRASITGILSASTFQGSEITG